MIVKRCSIIGAQDISLKLVNFGGAPVVEIDANLCQRWVEFDSLYGLVPLLLGDRKFTKRSGFH